MITFIGEVLINDDSVDILERLVSDYSDLCCDHPEDCSCSMGQAWRFVQNLPRKKNMAHNETITQ